MCLVRGFVFLLKFLPTPVKLSADAALSFVRHTRLESAREFIRALSRSSRGAEMKTKMSPRALVFSSGCPERNAVSIATCRHSVMTGMCVCVRALLCVCWGSTHGHNNVELCVVAVECGVVQRCDGPIIVNDYVPPSVLKIKVSALN